MISFEKMPRVDFSIISEKDLPLEVNTWCMLTFKPHIILVGEQLTAPSAIQLS